MHVCTYGRMNSIKISNISRAQIMIRNYSVDPSQLGLLILIHIIQPIELDRRLVFYHKESVRNFID